MRRTALAALCIVAATTAGLTGCQAGQDTADGTSSTSAKAKESKEPFDGLSGGEIVDRAFKATTTASSLRMAGEVPGDESSEAIQFDMAMNTGGECTGTLSIGGKGEAELIRTADTVYVKYDETFLRAQSEGEPSADVDAAVSMMADRWTQTSATDDADGLDAFCDLDGLLEGFTNEGHSNASRGRTSEVAGTPALTLSEKDGEDTYTVHVATEGKPYVLRIDSTSATAPSSLTFGDYDEPVRAEKPAGDILDLDALGG